ncbi:unnamed protein product [Spodoptera littoralis]|uniref:CCHC-type domain-containing protein n=1 Tax=Spodoptera littoralis TaxID=7109 RepID=A0A9P0I289_SPOLI|nr:unnamed protein product [Spodoptera littoralis]CAH1638459.1 unnamed protein product [Spodoptera littoralis]
MEAFGDPTVVDRPLRPPARKNSTPHVSQRLSSVRRCLVGGRECWASTSQTCRPATDLIERGGRAGALPIDTIQYFNSMTVPIQRVVTCCIIEEAVARGYLFVVITDAVTALTRDSAGRACVGRESRVARRLCARRCSRDVTPRHTAARRDPSRAPPPGRRRPRRAHPSLPPSLHHSPLLRSLLLTDADLLLLHSPATVQRLLTSRKSLHVERADTCYRCGKEGHMAASCDAVTLHCAVCAANGRPANHVMAGRKCNPPTKKGKMQAQRRPAAAATSAETPVAEADEGDAMIE